MLSYQPGTQTHTIMAKLWDKQRGLELPSASPSKANNNNPAQAVFSYLPPNVTTREASAHLTVQGPLPLHEALLTYRRPLRSPPCRLLQA
jgi:hypothetical protein